MDSKQVLDRNASAASTLTGNEKKTLDDSNEEDTEKKTIPVEVTPEPQRQITGMKWAILLIAVLSSLLLCVMDHTILANVRPKIIDTFGHIELLPAVSVFYTLAIAAVTPFWGKLNSLFEKKKLYLSALAIFEIGSALNGAAQNMPMLIVGRFFAGIGSAGIYVGVTNIVSVLTVPTERAQYLSFIGIAWALGTILGPVIGGAFADSSATWRWAFYLNLCVAAVSAPVCIFLIPIMRPAGSQSVWQRIKGIDYVGTVLYTGGTIALILILSFGGSVYLWDSAQMIALYVVTGLVWPAFALQQATSFLTTDRLFPVQFVREWQMLVLFSWTAISMGSLLVPIYTLPLLYQFAFGYSSLSAAKYMLPFLGSTIATVIISGKFFPKFPLYMAWYNTSAVFLLIGSALLSTVDVDTSLGKICGYSVLFGIGAGLVAQIGLVVAQLRKGQALQAQVTTFLTCGQISGSVLAISISTCIFINLATNGLATVLPDQPRSEVQAAINGSGSDLFQRLAPDVRDRVIAVIARDAARIFYVNIAGAAFGLITALLMPRERLALK